MANDSGGSGFFGFIDILKGLPVVPKIIMFVGLLILIAEVFSGQFALFHNARIPGGLGVMLTSLSWRDWEQCRWHNPGPPYEGHWDFKHIVWGLFFGVLAVWMFRVCYLASK